MRGPTDGTLLGQAMDGDRAGFLRLVDRYAPLVAAVIQHHRGGSTETDKLVTAVFEQAFLEIRRISDPESFYKRLLQIAREKGQAARPTIGGENTAADSEGLPELARIVRWKYLEGLNYEEIGRRLGLPAQAIDLHIQRGRIHSRWSHLAAEGTP